MEASGNTSAGRLRPGPILVVCYGNICRSPLAEVLLRRRLEDAGLGAAWPVRSAGVHAREGLPAAPEAVAVAAEHGLDLSEHRSRRLQVEEARDAALRIALDEVVEEEILIQAGDDLSVRLWPVDDPYRGPVEGFHTAFTAIAGFVDALVDELSQPAGERG